MLVTALLVSFSLLAGQAEKGIGTKNARKVFKPAKNADAAGHDWLPAGTSPGEFGENRLNLGFAKNIVADQRSLWASPSRLRFVDVDWLLPVGLATGALLATDHEYSKHLSNSPARIKYSKDVSNYGAAALVGAGGGLYLWGRMSHNEHQRETGFLAGEAALDSFTAVYALKYAFGRERPQQNNYGGQFRRGGNSFPSEHAAAAWSIASVIAHEYPGPMTTFLAYGMAAAVSASRITAKQHFPSDVFIGSALGWFVGQQIYRRRHDATLGGGEWQTYRESFETNPGGVTHNAGSPYVQLDSWIYPAILRLAARGYVSTAFLGMRPWTRLECAHLVEDAGDAVRHREDGDADVAKIYYELSSEFQSDLRVPAEGLNPMLHLESVYTRGTQIGGEPLNDSYHFGQTIISDYGRRYQRGFNSYDGFSGWGTAGRFAIYIRGEMQHSPAAAGNPPALQNLIAGLDGTPVQAAAAIPSRNQVRLLDAYLAANVAGWSMSFGKQSLWWGPGEGSALLYSNNAEPNMMFRASRTAPFALPWIFSRLGPMKWDVFFGQLSGNSFPPRPLLHGEKISFKPTENLELGFSRTVEMGGTGRPLTIGHLLLSYFSVTSQNNQSQADKDPGKRTGGFDFSYRLPWLRNWISVYSDSLADDDPSPLAAPRRAGVNPGIYLTRFPKLKKLDLRVEGVNTNTSSSSRNGHFIYWDSFYRQLYTNNNNLIGSWIGREGQGLQAWATYSATSRNTIQFGYRHAKVASDFLPGGETVNDGSLKINWRLREAIYFSGYLQYEKWLAPVLAAGQQTNWTSTMQLRFEPGTLNWLARHGSGHAGTPPQSQESTGQ